MDVKGGEGSFMSTYSSSSSYSSHGEKINITDIPCPHLIVQQIPHLMIFFNYDFHAS